eukprot:PITA_13029
MKFWEERYNPEKEKLLEAPLWVRLFGLPDEFWDPEILEGIGNSIGSFVKAAEATHRGKYNSCARICVYVNLAEPLPDHVEVEYHDEVWEQPVDYEHIPFRCRKCHEYGHLVRQCPLNKEDEQRRSQEEQQKTMGKTGETEKGFQQVTRRRRQNQEKTKPQPQEKEGNFVSQNKFQDLRKEDVEYEVNLEDDEDPEKSPMDTSGVSKEKIETPGDSSGKQQEGNVEDLVIQTPMEVENQVAEEIEEERILKQSIQEWKYLDSRFIPEQQKQLYKEVFQKYKEKKGQLMIGPDLGTGQTGMDGSGKNSLPGERRKRGRKSLIETIQTVGETLINSGKVIPLSERYLKEKLKKEKPSVMILQETKISVHQIEKLIDRYKMHYEVMGQDAIGSAGGIAILWNPDDIILDSWTSMRGILTGLGRIVGTREQVVISGVYGPSSPGEKENFLNYIQSIRRIYSDVDWIIGGDFNLIRSLEEKKGGIRKSDSLMGRFNALIEDLRLVDIQTINGIYTWNNRRGGKNQIASRLDRFLVSESILNKDIFVEAQILPSLGSDHWPIKLEVDIKVRKGKRPFRFESFWLRDPSFIKKLEEWWCQSTIQSRGKMRLFQLKLKELKEKIKSWNKQEFGNILEDKQKLEKEMESIQQKMILEGRTEESISKEGSILGQLEERRKQEEILWRQKSRIKWLREGERNTKFFHQAMIKHRQSNRILSIKDRNGNRVMEQAEIEQVLIEHHKEILKEPQTDRTQAIQEICSAIPCLVSEDQNKALMRAATLEEIEETVKAMKKGTAPGPDGFTVDFYQAGWHFLGKEILEMVEESKMNQKVWPALNSTFYALIPKTENREDPNGFRPIALCNVIYKIITAMMARRLKPMLEKLISAEQTGFVEGRQILDGLVVTQEVIHSLKTKHQKGMMIKLDLSKAYDRLNWNYLSKVLESFGFCKRWINWIHNLISSPIFSILVNGIPSNPFSASRGLRQGDPLSPFLFILAAEGLGRFIKRERESGKIKGLKLWGHNLCLTHQQFVDDIMLFGEPTVKEVKHLRKILDIFAEASGLEINKDKSQIFIFNSVEQVKVHLTRLLGFRQGELPTKYLGNILDFSSKKMKNWQGILDKLSNKVANWAFRSLNITSRIVLAKSVLQAIPVYPLSIMAAPIGICTKIREIIRNFIWRGVDQKKKWALVSWGQLTERKEKGGLGLRDPETLNKVLGAKLWWRWLGGGNDLWKTIWRVKYSMPESVVEILKQKNTPRGSSVWDLARLNRELVEQHTFWEIRGGEEVHFWEDKWQQKARLNSIQTLQPVHDRIGRNRPLVRDYWKANPADEKWRTWVDLEEWEEDFSLEQKTTFKKEVVSRKIRIRTGSDILRWGNSIKGSFSTKEAYFLTSEQLDNDLTTDWRIIWERNWWPKVSMFIWLATKNKILTWDRIQKKGFIGPSRCCLCKLEEETRDHLLIHCPFAKTLWIRAKRTFGKPENSPCEFKEVVFQWNAEVFQCQVVRRAWDLISGFSLWMIWKERNRRIFQNSAMESDVIWGKIIQILRETILADKWDGEDWKANPMEGEMLNRLNLKFEMVFHKQNSPHTMRNNSADKFYYPKDDFIKLNFDGASKGNPGDAGFGGIFRDSNNQVRWIFAEWGGEMTNNEAEFWALHQGLQIAVRNGYSNLEITGDSQIAIEMLKKLCNGRNWDKVSNSWRSVGIVQEIASLLPRIGYAMINHVRRKGNQAADYLANWGCKGHGSSVDSQWRVVSGQQEWSELASIIKEDHDQASGSGMENDEMKGRRDMRRPPQEG